MVAHWVYKVVGDTVIRFIFDCLVKSRDGGFIQRRRGKAQALAEQGTTRKGLRNNQGTQQSRQELGCNPAGSHDSSPYLLPGPQCPLPFSESDVLDGVVFCETASGAGVTAVQRCQLLCRQGRQSAVPLGPLICDLESQRWVSPPPPRACQRE